MSLFIYLFIFSLLLCVQSNTLILHMQWCIGVCMKSPLEIMEGDKVRHWPTLLPIQKTMVVPQYQFLITVKNH